MKRILILGDKGVGKTTFMNIFLNKQLPEHEQPTLGVQAGAKTIEFEDRSFVNLQVWDTPGQQQYAEMAYPFYNNCKLFVIVLDRLRIETLKSLDSWFQKIESNNPSNPNTILILLNKTPKILHTGNKHQAFTKQSLQSTYQAKLKSLEYKDFDITIMQVDLIEERDQLNKMYLHPFLYKCLREEIVTEMEEKRIERCGGMDCRNEGCEVM